jgi:hypothetical protein
MSPVRGCTCRCERLFSLMKNVKLRTRTRLTDESLERDACESQQQKITSYKNTQTKGKII